QFDPELVERFIACVKSRCPSNSAADTVTKEAAAAIGVHIEQLVTALEQRDFSSLRDLAGHMQSVAHKQGASDIAEQAKALQASLESDSEESDLLAVLYEAASLLKRSEEHTSELQSLAYLVCRLLLEKKNNIM